jgi:hypothetical protein
MQAYGWTALNVMAHALRVLLAPYPRTSAMITYPNHEPE